MFQVELHRHLDVSTRMSTLHELCIEQKLIDENTTIADFKEEIAIRSPLEDLSAVLDQFTIYQRVLQNKDILKRIARETVIDCYNEGTRVVELRYSPSFVGEYNSISWEEIHESFLEGIQEAQQQRKDIKAGLICIISRDRELALIEKTAEFYLNNLDTFIGIDLAGSENKFPAKLFESVFHEIRKATPEKITIHAGEGSGSQNIWDAIDILGAKRIGHGVDCIDDPELIEVLKKKKICLEICPTSNYLTQATKTLADNPLPSLLKKGVPVSINTDDPSIFDTTLSNEIDICLNILKMPVEDVAKCFEHAKTYSFLDQA